MEIKVKANDELEKANGLIIFVCTFLKPFEQILKSKYNTEFILNLSTSTRDKSNFIIDVEMAPSKVGGFRIYYNTDTDKMYSQYSNFSASMQASTDMPYSMKYAISESLHMVLNYAKYKDVITYDQLDEYRHEHNKEFNIVRDKLKEEQRLRDINDLKNQIANLENQ
jgi:hypothetical protein